eukprot:SAG31_NODE_7097_length_1789_cov_1.772781_3_plen_172_part_00
MLFSGDAPKTTVTEDPKDSPLNLMAFVARSSPEACHGGAQKGCLDQEAMVMDNLRNATVGGEATNQLHRHVAEDNHFWLGGFKLEGSWPAIWRRGVQVCSQLDASLSFFLFLFLLFFLLGIPCAYLQVPLPFHAGCQYDLNTVRANIRPAAGVFKHPWDAMQVHSPRIVGE